MDLVADGPNVWSIPAREGMRVPGRIFASEALIVKARVDRALDQVANVAHLPGIVGHSIAMPDIHWGYGFPIGGVAATDVSAGGVISPGGVGFDIGCGVRLLRSDLSFDDIKLRTADLAKLLARRIPRGVGQKGLAKLTASDLESVMSQGVSWALGRGIGEEQDEEYSEDRGRLAEADPSRVSERASERGLEQLGSLGAGNHFVEVQVVDGIFHDEAAKAMGLAVGQICVMIHTGSRGLGHQICTEDIRKVDAAMRRHGIEVPDRQLACVPVNDPSGESYLGAMAAAANFARVNRHVLADAVRECFKEKFDNATMDLVYDVSHNVAKMENFEINGKQATLCVHRKGATRARGPGDGELPSAYSHIGQPVLIPGSMGTASWVLVGTEASKRLSFSSTCHGAGRMMSRKAAVKQQQGSVLRAELEGKGILVEAQQMRLLAEEAPYAYKDVDEVVEVCDAVGLSKKVARLRPVAVIKG